MMKTLDLKAIPAILEKYSQGEFVYRQVTEKDINEGYFDVLGQLTSLGKYSPEEAVEFYKHHLKSNPMFLMFVVVVGMSKVAQSKCRDGRL